ncbi:MAG: MoxR family ATPase [Spirochaetia bacterium]|nr:MoxR family ATPase [Spirochaetia bacterium]
MTVRQTISAVDLDAAAQDLRRVRAEVGRVFVGQTELLDGALSALFAGGHVLIEGVPGLGKTLLVRAMSRALGAVFARIQFTPDLMPSDITGSHIYNQHEQRFIFNQGPVFTNLLLADEINRAPAKTHSALLEIMQENQVTIDNRLFKIELPFFVMATQNPVESEGTYSLPEAQLDRFLLKLLINYPTEPEELSILRLHADGAGIDPNVVGNVLSKERILEIMGSVQKVHVSDALLSYINGLVRASRVHEDVYLGASPRAGIALLRTARVLALTDGRAFVIPDDVKRMTPAAFRHRILLKPEAEVEGGTPDDVIRDVIGSVEVPREVR